MCPRRSRLVRGGWGRCRVFCLPRFPLPTPRFLRCVWLAVPSGSPLSSLAGTSFHAVCAFCGLGPVALLVFPACPLCVCAHSRSSGVRAPRRAGPVLGAGRAVPRGPWPSACPVPVPCSVWLATGGGGPVLSPTYLAWGCALPVGWVCASGAFHCGRVGGGAGGRPARRPPRRCSRGGQWGGGSPYLGSSLCLPWAGNKAGVFGVALAMEGLAPIPLRFVLACCPRAQPVWRPRALARVCLSIAVPAGAGGWGRGGGDCCPPPPPGAAVLPGGGEAVPSAFRGGGGPAPPWPAGQ